MTAMAGNCIFGSFSTLPDFKTSLKRGMGLNMKIKLHAFGGNKENKGKKRNLSVGGKGKVLGEVGFH